jgi:hydroxyacylglutathione hydrolase
MRKGLLKKYSHFDVHVVPVLKDNFSYVIRCASSKAVAAVDVSEAPPIIKTIDALEPETISVLSTHKHWDHTGGNEDMIKRYKGIKVYGGEKDPIPAMNAPLADEAVFRLGELSVRVLHTPCHTAGHVLYHVYHQDAPNEGALFTGDTIFVGGIGAFFEGDANQMLSAIQRVVQLPPSTDVYCGHEYALNFFKFACSLLPEDRVVQERAEKLTALRHEGLPTVPSTVLDECRTNVFFRTADPVLKKLAGKDDAHGVMEYLYNACP